jgi:hypothetical protein
MPVLKKKSWKDRMMAAFKTGDEKEVEKIASEVKDEDESEEEREAREKKEKETKTEDSLKKVLDKLNAMDEDIKELKKKVEDEGEEEDPDGTMDTVLSAETAGKLSDAGVKLYTGDSAKHIPAMAEILAPGTKLPTFDAKTTDAQRALALCKCQRKALDAAYATDAGREAITPFLGGYAADFGKLPLPVLNAAFFTAAHLMRAKNNDGTHKAALSTKDFGRQTSVSDINTRNREFYNKR